MNGCIQQHRQALEFARQMGRECDRSLHDSNARLSDLRIAIVPVEADLARISGEIAVVKRELQFLESPPLRPRYAIAGQLSLDDLFEIPRIRRSWDERYPAERAAKMRARLNELRVRESEQKTQLDKILPSYRAVSDEYQSALAQKNKWLGEEAQHSAMCESGCQNDICPTGF